jgi:hypothetical protein
VEYCNLVGRRVAISD